MSSITFKEIDKEIEKQIVDIWGDWVIKYGCLHYGEGCYSLAAICEDKPVGFISTYPLQLPEPLQMYYDAYIDDLVLVKLFCNSVLQRCTCKSSQLFHGLLYNEPLKA